MKSSVKFFAWIAVSLLSGTAALRANQVTVTELPFSPGVQTANISVTGFYTGGVYAGVNHLSVDGTTMNGFCIDPFRFSGTAPQLYTVVPLDQAPKAPGTMNATQAAQISKLWAEFYSPTMASVEAAGMQIAIWEIVAGSRFSVVGSDYGASAMIAGLTAYTGAGADLVGLTGPGQDYVVPRTAALRVPENGSSLALLGLSLMALLACANTQQTLRLCARMLRLSFAWR